VFAYSKIKRLRLLSFLVLSCVGWIMRVCLLAGSLFKYMECTSTFDQRQSLLNWLASLWLLLDSDVNIGPSWSFLLRVSFELTSS
jgi:hypothetical protein